MSTHVGFPGFLFLSGLWGNLIAFGEDTLLDRRLFGCIEDLLDGPAYGYRGRHNFLPSYLIPQ